MPPTKLVPLLEGRGETDGKPTAYVCRKQACLAPVTTAESLAAQLEGDEIEGLVR